MSALNVSNIVNDWIEKKLNLPFTIYNDVIPDTSDNAACLRYDPAPAAERRYTDGTRLLKWNLTYYVRNKNRHYGKIVANKHATWYRRNCVAHTIRPPAVLRLS